ncbi:pyrroloquinoline quinone biosynthesis protein PqqE [Kitasatospora azatica]|uniref:pyrroloquinoline quinone biosynthesis protein PqqE n=1 Tax=Kitasatospora azatica TaxID=58347 RepID=UPI0005667FB7|nr:pyrroloquinoline quinone biosynthesis protein PqqE [Kitasatospora azatica]
MSPAVERPLGLLAELTYRCPLACGYCANPVALDDYADELSTAEWIALFAQAQALGVLQVHLSGGEPLARRDLVELVTAVHRQGLYTSLITGGQALTAHRTAQLVAAGLDHVQLSLQDAEPSTADRIAGRAVHRRKLAAAALVREAGLALSLNVVLHRANIDRVPQLIDLAVELGADRLELANAQYYGWALVNRAALLPTPEQLLSAEQAVRAGRHRLPALVYVPADYYEEWPKPCMAGWGSRQLTVAPNGTVLPCPAAGRLAGPAAPTVRDSTLAQIWFDAPLFNRFRGTDWMAEPCRSCERREQDHGGCRCQAFELTGDAAVADPVCRLSPHRPLVDAFLATRSQDSGRSVIVPRPPGPRLPGPGPRSGSRDGR